MDAENKQTLPPKKGFEKFCLITNSERYAGITGATLTEKINFARLF